VVVSNPPCLIEPAAILQAGNRYCAAYREKDKSEYKGAGAEFVKEVQELCSTSCAQVSSILAELIYNSVTTLLVGEKTMIEMPTYFFPAGAG
jgi:hypothetical protein